MSEGHIAAGAAQRVGSGSVRVARAWKVLPPEARMAGIASIALFVTLFLPWYQVTVIAQARTAKLQSATATITGWGAFSFVEAAVLIVAAAVLVLLFQRAEGRAFHLPGGDGGVITAAGLWTCLLIVWRIFDKQGATTHGPSATTSGIEWGIFFALAAAAFLAYSGSRIRAAHLPEPPLPGETGPPPGSNAATATVSTVAPPLATRRAAARSARPAAPTSGQPLTPRSDNPVAPRSDDAAAPRSEQPAPPRRRRRATAATPPAPAPDAPPRRPRTRAPAHELFERVVPQDPPTMHFADRRPRSAPTPAPAPASAAEKAEDDQLTIPMGEDDTLPFPRDDDDTVPLDRS
jgi:hypothetical protein